MENNDIFDLAKTLEQVGGDRELLGEIIGIYAEEYPKQIEELREGINKKDAATVECVAHAIKGAVSNFGAEPARQTALQLEEIGKSKDLAQAADVFNVLKEELERLERELKNI